MTAKHCCKDMAKAHEPCTDNEMYGALAYDCGGITFGCDLPPIKFCPWCGKPCTADEVKP